MTFSEAEKNFILSQRLLRIATVDNKGQVDVAPVGFRFDGEKFMISGRATEKTLKHKNVVAGNDKVALVLDDLETTDPWKPRGVKIHGTAVVIKSEASPYLEVTPVKHWSWGIEGSSYAIKKTEH